MLYHSTFPGLFDLFDWNTELRIITVFFIIIIQSIPFNIPCSHFVKFCIFILHWHSKTYDDLEADSVMIKKIASKHRINLFLLANSITYQICV